MHYEHQVRVHGNHHSYSTKHNRANTDYGNKNDREMGGGESKSIPSFTYKRRLTFYRTVAGTTKPHYGMGNAVRDSNASLLVSPSGEN